MPRKPRMYIAGMPALIVQRGNDRQPCFYEEDDYHWYLECLTEACECYDVALHAYVLMPDHVHLLMTPRDVEGISRVIQSVGRRYVQSINYKYGKTGTLWEGRHKSSIVDVDGYLLACYRYIELNPVRAGIVEHPRDYIWSSYRCNAYGASQFRVAPHELYQSLAKSAEAQRLAYRELFGAALHTEHLYAIRNAIRFSMPLGDSDFRKRIEALLERPIGYAKRGRPPSGFGVEESAVVYCV